MPTFPDQGALSTLECRGAPGSSSGRVQADGSIVKDKSATEDAARREGVTHYKIVLSTLDRIVTISASSATLHQPDQPRSCLLVRAVKARRVSDGEEDRQDYPFSSGVLKIIGKATALNNFPVHAIGFDPRKGFDFKSNQPKTCLRAERRTGRILEANYGKQLSPEASTGRNELISIDARAKRPGNKLTWITSESTGGAPTKP
ncbi:hypothetical protein BDZ89DRAFT_1050132 [Hymenopellis radicata]|nr:hypothetical protein BDZ89DRAFT_1050132 [Hymenopellis radicata]